MNSSYIRFIMFAFIFFAWHDFLIADYNAENSVVVADIDGNKVVVWTANDLVNSVTQIRGNTYTVENGWSRPFSISNIVGETSLSVPKIAIDSTGNVLVAWLAYIISNDSFVITTKNIPSVISGSWGSLSSSQVVNDPADYAQSNFKLICEPNDSFTITFDANIGKTGNSVIQTSTISSFDGTWPASLTMLSDI